MDKQYAWLDQYLLSRPGATKDYKAEWGWHRYLVGGKMFAALMHPSEKYDPLYAQKDLINLKCDPLMAELLRKEHPGNILPGFYTGKEQWNSVDLGAGLARELVQSMADDSYRLIFAKLTKKLQKELLEQGGT